MLCKILLFVVLNMTNGYTFTHRNEIYKDLRKKTNILTLTVIETLIIVYNNSVTNLVFNSCDCWLSLTQ